MRILVKKREGILMEKQTHIPKASESYILKKTKIYQINIYHINVGIEPRNHVKLGSILSSLYVMGLIF